MATVFYFNSLQRPIAVPRGRLSPNNKAKLDRRRRATKMDTHTHACMARFDEPTFCPSVIGTLLARYPMLSPAHSGLAGSSTPDLVDDDDDDGDDHGGVPLHLNDTDRSMTDVFAGTHLTGTEQDSAAWQPNLETATSSGEHATCTPRVQTPHQGLEWPSSEYMHGSSTVPRTPPSHRQSFSVLGSSHPRPHSQESWEEEDGRRLRFALDGEDTGDVPQFAVPEMSPIDDVYDRSIRATAPPWTFSWSSAALENSRRNRQVDAIQYQPLQARSRSIPPPLTDNSTTQSTDLPAANVPANSNLIEISQRTVITHSDFMTVDDPEWSYDFADFLDTWHLRSQLSRRIPPVGLGLPQSEGITKRPHYVCRSDVEKQAVDSQGLDWNALGVSRHDAIAARTLLHPSKQVSLRTHSASTSQQHASEAESTYRFRSFTAKHRANFSHYQLRNVLAASDRSDIYFANDSKVYSTSLACPSVQNIVMDLAAPRDAAAPFRITCLATSKNSAFQDYQSSRLVVCGGFYGEYALLNLDSEFATSMSEGSVTHAYNGLVTNVHAINNRRSGLPEAIFCSNDSKVRILDTSTLRFTNTFAYNHAINCASTSPDGRLRALVGDSQEAHIADAEGGDVLVTLRGHTDHGFACAWAPNGIHVATGAQDGRTLVWDARNWSEPLRSLPSVMSTPRSLHFTEDNALLVAEDDDVVSIYDAGSYEKQQDIRFFGSIAGLALLDGGAEIVVANIDKTVGGLMSFERTARGSNNGSFGQRMSRSQRASRQRSQTAYPCGFASNVFV